MLVVVVVVVAVAAMECSSSSAVVVVVGAQWWSVDAAAFSAADSLSWRKRPADIQFQIYFGAIKGTAAAGD